MSASAFGACASLVDDREVVRWVAGCAAQDPSPAVQRACLSAIARGCLHGSTDLLLDIYLAHAQQNPSAEVREGVAQSLHWLPADPRLTHIVATLFADRSSEVRRAIAWQSDNMSEHPELRDLYMQAATSDPDESVRADALSGLHNFFPLAEAVAFLRQRLADNRNEATYDAVLHAAEDHMPPARPARWSRTSPAVRSRR